MRGWVRKIRDQCQKAGVPFFFKQWGGVRKSQTGRRLDGKTYDEFPERNLMADHAVTTIVNQALAKFPPSPDFPLR